MNDNNQFNDNQYGNNQINNDYNVPQDKGSFGWAVLGFFIPIVGIILFFAWKKTKPLSAKKAGIGGLIGFIINFFIIVIFPILFWGSVQNSLVDKTCKTYGETYKSEQVGNTWYCVNTVTGQRIELE